ncbi:lactonase family protein [Streptacidiphilus melanogenes]|uniref:lactonase family protein n=1 Tax=Streptacidiphilus melanogenes TaxID=411235 RepID=UPI0005AB0E38|nr:beta-propeller fold lactonase family protein [Streptacidiphilus melanogenes]
MRTGPRRLGTAVATALATLTALVATAPATSAATGAGVAKDAGGSHAVFVQTNDPAGNQIVAYHREGNGRLIRTGTFDTGGKGGQLQGSVADHLASQGALTYDSAHGLLFAVNAGSNTVSVFSVRGDRLELRQVIRSGGRFPVSVAVHCDTVYVLNALDGGSIQGYTLDGDHLRRHADWRRRLGLDPHATPQFTNTPGQVGFTGDGSHLVVTTKANGNNLEVFGVAPSGAPSDHPRTTNFPDAVPFGFVPNGPHGIFLTEAGPNALTTVDIHRDGAAEQVAFAATGQQATCWVVAIRDLLYTSNAGSNSVSGFRATDRGRHLTALGQASTDPGTIDAAASEGGRFLYVLTGVNGVVDEFSVAHDGTLTQIGSAVVPHGAGSEGIVAF